VDAPMLPLQPRFADNAMQTNCSQENHLSIVDQAAWLLLKQAAFWPPKLSLTHGTRKSQRCYTQSKSTDRAIEKK